STISRMLHVGSSTIRDLRPILAQMERLSIWEGRSQVDPVKAQQRVYNLNKGVESLSKEEHGLFFDAMQRLGLPNEVKLAAVALYLDFKGRPNGEYHADTNNLEIFLIA